MRKRFLLPYQIAFLFALPLIAYVSMLGGLTLSGPLIGMLFAAFLLGLFSFGLARLTKRPFLGDLVGFVFMGLAVLVFLYIVVFGTSDTTGWADLGLIVTSLLAFVLGMMSRGWMLVVEWWFGKQRNKKSSTAEEITS
jgi:hypothetical protein